MTAARSSEASDGDAAPCPPSVVSLPATQMLQGLLRVAERHGPDHQYGSIAARGLLLRQTADALKLLRTQFSFIALAYEAQCLVHGTPEQLALPSDNLKGFLQIIDQLVETTDRLRHDMSMVAC